MSEWALKRFWGDTSVAQTEDGFAIHLDGRPVRTPAKAPLIFPSRPFAEAVATEWEAQVEKVDPATMPLTRLANSAIDNVANQFADVADMLAEYGASDLLCYRAHTPPELAARQGAAWDPLLAWAEAQFKAPLNTGEGVMHVAQPEESVAALRAEVHALSAFELAAFHDLVAISGSLVLALAAIHERAAADEIWQVSRIDEDWQAEQWGHDDEAAETAALKRTAFLTAHRAFVLLRAV